MEQPHNFVSLLTFSVLVYHILLEIVNSEAITAGKSYRISKLHIFFIWFLTILSQKILRVYG